MILKTNKNAIVEVIIHLFMNHKTFEPSTELASVVKLYWTLKVPAEMAGQKQLIVPDGCIDMIFILGDDIVSYKSNGKFGIQPRAMILGQITEAFFVEPKGHVDSFAVRFYPHSFSYFVPASLKDLANKETPLVELLDEKVVNKLNCSILQAKNTSERIATIENFLRNSILNREKIDVLVRDTVQAMLTSNGSLSVKELLLGETTKRRQLERRFMHRVGVSPKQLSKVIRLQTVIKLMLNDKTQKLANVAYESNYYDQAHFIKDFKEFTGVTPQKFFESDQMVLSSVLYK